MYTEYYYKYISTIRFSYISTIEILKTISIIEIKLYLINETISI